MDSLTTLATVLQHAQAERDQALGALRQAEDAAEAARNQSHSLEAYRGEYRARWTDRFRQDTTVELLHCYQGFAGRLDQAITLQSRATEQADRRVQQARELLMTREQRVAAVTKLMERRRNELQRAASRREQRQLDETASRLGMAARLASPLN
jgi:flagellar protein FliJ